MRKAYLNQILLLYFEELSHWSNPSGVIVAKNLKHVWKHLKQESPPAWTQEAYRPPCSKYSLCCPNWVPPPRPGSPPPARVSRPPPGWTWQGTPPPSCPMAFWEMLQSIMGYGYPPPPVDKLTKWKYYLPVVLRTRAVIIAVNVVRLQNLLFEENQVKVEIRTSIIHFKTRNPSSQFPTCIFTGSDFTLWFQITTWESVLGYSGHFLLGTCAIFGDDTLGHILGFITGLPRVKEKQNFLQVRGKWGILAISLMSGNFIRTLFFRLKLPSHDKGSTWVVFM